MSGDVPPQGTGHPSDISFSDVVRLLWRKLKEMRTLLHLFIIVGATSLLGTLVPQGEAPGFYQERYGTALGAVVLRTGLNHLFSTTWFLALLALVMLSLAACSRRLWVQACERWRVPDASAASKRARGAKGTVTATVPLKPSEAADALTQTARQHRYRAWLLGSEQDSAWVHLCRNRWSLLGKPLAHYSVFLVAIGALMGVLPGLSVDTTIQVTEGQTHEASPDGLPFGVKVNDFRIERDPATGAVRNYYSEVSLLEDDQVVAQETISVNHPLAHRHFYLSQATWGLSEARVKVTLNGKATELSFPLDRGCLEHGGADDSWGIPQGDAAAFLPGDKAALVATGFYADAKRRGDEVIGTSGEFPGTPALAVTLVSGFHGTDHKMDDLGWLFPEQPVNIKGGQVEFLGAVEWTGLGVRKDYGVPIVWLGFTGCLLGLVLIYYWPARWATVSWRPKGQAATVVSVAFDCSPGEEDAATGFWRGFLAELRTVATRETVPPRQEVLQVD